MDPVDNYVERTNDARIIAVHRGSKPVAQREAIDALRGAIRVTVWYHFIDSRRRYGP